MTRTQLLLAKLAEECAEVGQMALKTQQFGMEEVYAGQGLSNAERIHLELDDLMAIIEMLNDESGLGYLADRDRIHDKKRKVNRWAAHAERLGMVSTGEQDA